MKKLIVGVFEDFFFPVALFMATISLVVCLVVLTPWFITNIFHSEAVNYCLVMGMLSFPVGMALVIFRPNYGNETWLAKFYTKHYTMERRALYFALNGVVGYMVLMSMARVFDKESQLYLVAGMISNIILMFLVCSTYWLTTLKWNRG